MRIIPFCHPGKREEGHFVAYRYRKPRGYEKLLLSRSCHMDEKQGCEMADWRDGLCLPEMDDITWGKLQNYGSP